MADWGRTLAEILDGMTLPQFRLLAKMRQRRITDDRRWDLQIASLSLQTEEQSEAWSVLMDNLTEAETGEPAQADMGGGFTVSKRHPLLHELTEAQVRADPQLRRIIRFRKITEPSSVEA